MSGRGGTEEDAEALFWDAAIGEDAGLENEEFDSVEDVCAMSHSARTLKTNRGDGIKVAW